MSRPPISLEPAEHARLSVLHSSLPIGLRARSMKLLNEISVTDVDSDQISGVIYDGQDYEWSVFPKESDEEVHYCDCPCAAFRECPHMAAILNVILRTSSLRKPDSAAAAPAVPAVQQMWQGEPDTAALHFAKVVQHWWETNRAQVSRDELVKLCTAAYFYDPRQVRLYAPEFICPENFREYLSCVVAAVEDMRPDSYVHWRIPPAILEAVDRQWLQSFRERSQRQQFISQWRATLRTWDDGELQEKAGAAPVPELRLLLGPAGGLIQIRRPDQQDFGKLTAQVLKQLRRDAEAGDLALDPCSAAILHASRETSRDKYHYGSKAKLTLAAGSGELVCCLQQLLSNSEHAGRHLAGEDGAPLEVHTEPLHYELTEPSSADGDYVLHLRQPDGKSAPAPVAVIRKTPPLYITPGAVWTGPAYPFPHEQKFPQHIPAVVLESSDGLRMLSSLGLPPPQRIAASVKVVPLRVKVKCRLYQYPHSSFEYLQLAARASAAGGMEEFLWSGETWGRVRHAGTPASTPELLHCDRSLLGPAAAWLRHWQMRPAGGGGSASKLEQRTNKDFPDLFLDWLNRRPHDVILELDPSLTSLSSGIVSGTFALAVEQSKTGIDWFDLTMHLKVEDHTLSPAEIDLLLKAKGRWVRLPDKGWRKLQFDLTPGQEQELAHLGISSGELNGTRHRLHALQMAGVLKHGSTLLRAEHAAKVQRRIDDIRMDVTPAQPAEVTATLRPYQIEGFHFLAFLSTNRFGGVLADDMGLGKTLQALTWLAWLRTVHGVRGPVLVVCPKSVQDNWRSEAARFFPSLPVHTWFRGAAGVLPENMDGLLIVHYPQLRLHEALLQPVKWAAVILDEAQAIKNPSSRTASAACALNAAHRLALTGTPVENRLMDLWAIFAFAMPGLLGTRASFSREFDGKTDPLARRRLSARTRPFLLRRTKKEVASDLPDRVEEDVMIEMEGPQAALYQAELKRARAQLLNISTGSQLDKLRFNILTSLLRLRQICCHPALIGLDADDSGTKPARGKKKSAAGPAAADSAKLSALMEHLEAIIEEEQKVLVFSQFTGMLDLIAAETDARGWQRFLLTGQTEDRGALVSDFQNHTGPAVFLISLKAGGFGLNLTAASYVVLYDPWWNPAVEAQAIDRTHRIGQKQTVFAYRLLMKDSIEEKIRTLQKQKGALAHDILGEENFARALSLDDFRFLLSE